MHYRLLKVPIKMKLAWHLAVRTFFFKLSFYVVIRHVTLDNISIKQQQMGDVRHQPACAMCFLAITCSALIQSWGCYECFTKTMNSKTCYECFTKMMNSKTYQMKLLNEHPHTP